MKGREARSLLCRHSPHLILPSAFGLIRRAMDTATDPVEKLRYFCLSRGATGILGLGRFEKRREKLIQ